MELGDALTPAGAGATRVLTSWQQFARHTDMPCERCLAACVSVRMGRGAPGELLDHCCEAGQALIGAWLGAIAELVDHLVVSG